MFYSTLLESCGAVTEARDVLSNLISQQTQQQKQKQSLSLPDESTVAPGISLEVVFRASDLERRVLQDDPETQFTAVTSLLDMAFASSPCRVYRNTILCRKSIFIANSASARGGLLAAIMIVLCRGEASESEVEGGRDSCSSSLSGDSLHAVPTSLLEKVFQYDVDLSLLKVVYDLLLLCSPSPTRDNKVDLFSEN